MKKKKKKKNKKKKKKEVRFRKQNHVKGQFKVSIGKTRAWSSDCLLTLIMRWSRFMAPKSAKICSSKLSDYMKL